MLQRVPTFIRRERRALVSLSVISAVALAILLAVSLAGDQRRVAAVLSSPASGEEVPVTLTSIVVTFDAEVSETHAAERLTLDPPVPGVLRQRGRSIEIVFTEPLEVGRMSLSIDAGPLGRSGEELEDRFELAFSVREPGVIFVAADGNEQRLVAQLGESQEELARAARISSYAVSRDGSRVAVVLAAADDSTELRVVEAETGDATVVVSDPSVALGDVIWAPDGGSLLVARRDRLPDGTHGAARIWLLRTDGTFVGEIDEEGLPSMAPAWSPDAQAVAYVTPTTSEVVVINLSTGQRTAVGSVRGRVVSWSPNSDFIAFEATPVEDTPSPPQPVVVATTAGETVLRLGAEREIRSQPRFLTNGTLLSLWRQLGADASGTELRFESLETGEALRAIWLADSPDFVTSWEIDPTKARVVYAVRSADLETVFAIDLESGDREVVALGADRARWLP